MAAKKQPPAGDGLQVLTLPHADLVLNDRNPRKTLNLGVLEKSIERYGFVNPVVGYRDPKTGKVHVVAGHHRIAAAKAKGIAQVPVILYPFKNAAEAKAFSVMDNRSSELVATWDTDLLRQEVDTLLDTVTDFDPTILGFDEADFRAFLAQTESMDGFKRTDFEEELVQGGFSGDAAKADGCWLYVEYYGEDARFARLVEALKPWMRTKHQMHGEAFEQMVQAWLATQPAQPKEAKHEDAPARAPTTP